MNQLKSVKDVAQILKLHEVTVRRLVGQGKLSSKKIGGKLFIDTTKIGISNSDNHSLLTYGELLKRGKAKIGVWGVGYIGFSTLAYYADRGIAGVGYDIDTKRVKRASRGEVDIPGFDEWLNVPLKHLIFHKLLTVTSSTKELFKQQPLIHFVCIPTERDGEPWLGPLRDVIEKIATFIQNYSLRPLVIIESTLTPGASDQVVLPLFKKHHLTVGKDFLFAVAPRRDWFVDREKTLKSLDRVYGGSDRESTIQTQSVLTIVCDKLHEAPTHRAAEMVKSVENAYRHMDITLANQLAMAYPKDHIRDVLRLVGTKWNAGTFYPSFGTGGYCIPLASKYVMHGAMNPAALTLLKATIETDQIMPKRVVDSLVKHKVKSVGILGLSYKGNLKVPHQSPTIRIARELLKKGLRAKVNDPYYNDQEIKTLTRCKAFVFPKDLHKFDALILVAGHALYNVPNVRKFLEKSRVKVIFDNVGFWKNLTCFNERGIAYYIPGDSNWLV